MIARGWSLAVLVMAAAAACKKDAPPRPVEGPPGEPLLMWVSAAGEGGERALPVAVDRDGLVYYGSRLRDDDTVQGKGRPNTSTRNDALFVAARDVRTAKGWVRVAVASTHRPEPRGLAPLGGGRVAVTVETNNKLADWGTGPVGGGEPSKVPAHLEQFRAASDRGSLGFAAYVVGARSDDLALLYVTKGEAQAVVTDDTGAIVVAGPAVGSGLEAWRLADPAECNADAPPVMIARWRDAQTPDWAACLPIDGEARVEGLAVAGDGDVLACVDVGTTREAGDSDEEGETSWTARLVRLDGASGRVVWTAGLKENQAGESACDGLATTSDGHVVLGQHDVDGLAVFAGKDKPALDATPTKADLFARGLQPGTIVTADDGTIQELDVASGAVVWSYKVPMSVNIDSIASGGGLVAITGSYDEAFDGGAAGKLSATDDLAGFVLVVRAPTQAR